MAATVGLTACSLGSKPDTPSGVAQSYLKALEKGDMERVMELTATELHGDASDAVQVDPPKQRISDVQIREESYTDGFPTVAATYKLGDRALSTKVTLGQVMIDGEPSYVVTNELPVVRLGSSDSEDSQYSINGEEVEPGSALLVVPGVYDVERRFTTQYLEEPTCTGIAAVTLGESGAISTEMKSADDCLTVDIRDLEPSGKKTNGALKEIEAAIATLTEKCSGACDSKTWEPVGPDGMREGVGWNSGGGNRGPLVRLAAHGEQGVTLSFADSAGGELWFTDSLWKTEYCWQECTLPESWSVSTRGNGDDILDLEDSALMSNALKGSFDDGEIEFWTR